MKIKITKYEEELVAAAEKFLDAAEKNPSSRAVLERYGYSTEERDRGRELVRDAKLAFEWEREGKAWRFISKTPERRKAEAKGWFSENTRRYVQSRFKAAEEAAGWTGIGPAKSWPLSRKLTLGVALAAKEVVKAADPSFWLEARAELKRDLENAKGNAPEGAPPPKDTVVVELRGWYERWHLLAHRVFRGRNDLLAPFGLTSGKAPPRLRGKAAREQYGEGAGGKLDGASADACAIDQDDDDDGLGPDPLAAKPEPQRPTKSLPIVN